MAHAPSTATLAGFAGHVSRTTAGAVKWHREAESNAEEWSTVEDVRAGTIMVWFCYAQVRLRTVALVLLGARQTPRARALRCVLLWLKQNIAVPYNKTTSGTAQVPVQVCCTPQVPWVPAYLHTVELLR